MKVGDIVRWKSKSTGNQPTGVVVSELRHGMNASFVDVLIDGEVIPVNWLSLKVIK
jgi:hypothetical protein